MGFWSNLVGKKYHCMGCGVVLPSAPKDERDAYCGEVCRANYQRLSTMPPPKTAQEDDSRPEPSDNR